MAVFAGHTTGNALLADRNDLDGMPLFPHFLRKSLHHGGGIAARPVLPFSAKIFTESLSQRERHRHVPASQGVLPAGQIIDPPQPGIAPGV